MNEMSVHNMILFNVLCLIPAEEWVVFIQFKHDIISSGDQI